MSKKWDLWMPLHVGDYLADTGHLSTVQHGAYLLLLMHYWRKRELPDDDKQLAAIAKLPLRIWLEIRPTLQAFFFDGWRHKRVESELQRRLEVSEKRAIAGAKGGSRTQMKHFINQHNAEANARICSSMTHTQRIITTTVSEDTAKARQYAASPELLASLTKKVIA